jgi:hypothetical protein
MSRADKEIALALGTLYLPKEHWPFSQGVALLPPTLVGGILEDYG